MMCGQDEPSPHAHDQTCSDLFEAMYTARALRHLATDAVAPDLITRILDAGIRAPSAGNAQLWTFVVVRDPVLRRELGRLYRKGSEIARAMYAARGRPEHMTEAQFQRMMTAGAWLWDHMGDAPVLLVPCMRDRGVPARDDLEPAAQAQYERELVYSNQIRGASIYPAIQNIILACRALGLATMITTNHIRCEDEVKDLLGIPPEVSTYALMPVGWPRGHFGPVDRRPVHEVTCADRWGSPWTSS